MNVKYFIFLTSVVFTLFLSGPAIAGPLDFSGSWELDEEASDTMEAIFNLQKISWIKKKLGARLDAKKTIQQTKEGMTILFDNLAGKITMELFFDGKPHLTKNPAGLDALLTTTWSEEHQQLIPTGPSKTRDGYEGTMTEIRTLSKDKSTMFLELIVKQHNGPEASAKRVFRRK